MCAVLIFSFLFAYSAIILAEHVDTVARSELKTTVLSNTLEIRDGTIAHNKEDQYEIVTEKISIENVNQNSDNIAFVLEKSYYDSMPITDKKLVKEKMLEEFHNKKRICFIGDQLNQNEILSIFDDSNTTILSSPINTDDNLIAVVYRMNELGRPRLTTYFCDKDYTMTDEEELSYILNNDFEYSDSVSVESGTAVVEVFGNGCPEPEQASITTSSRMVAGVLFSYARAARGEHGTLWDVKVNSRVEPKGSFRTVFVKNRMSQRDFRTDFDEILIDYWPKVSNPSGTQTFGTSGSESVSATVSGGTSGFNMEGTIQGETGESYSYTKTWDSVTVDCTHNNVDPFKNIEIEYHFSNTAATTAQSLLSGSRWWNKTQYFDTRYHCTFYVGDEVKELGQNIVFRDIFPSSLK